jgi:hypothetical protein
MEVMASMMFGCEDNKRINKVLREDNPEYSIFFGLPLTCPEKTGHIAKQVLE